MKKHEMQRAADNMRVLIAAMVERAKSGHPGGSMGGSDFTNVLYSNYLVYDPDDATWIGRDRFFLDPGHMSPMLYSVLALSGKYTLDELKDFRQWGSHTPGHPELNPERGVENSSGPLGQGHVMAVGAAIGERIIANRFGEEWAHKTYAFISDGGIQEEISQGAGRIAGTLGLNNLIMFYDANDVQLSTRVEEVTSEDTAAKYRAWDWHVIEIDGNDSEQIADAIEEANAQTEKPTLIIGHTIMAKGVVKADGSSMEGAVSTHGQPLSAAGADVAATIAGLGGNADAPFEIWEDVAATYAARREELKKIVAEKKSRQQKWAEANPADAELLQSYLDGKMPEIDWDGIECKPGLASRNASANVLGVLADNLGNMIVSSADLANSDKTDGFLKKTHAITKGDFSGRFLQAGVAELTMASVMNGIALHGGLTGACGTFFVFSDYIKPALRMSALMELPVKYVFTHDAFRVGEDGPTHEPVEQEAQMRLMEQMDNLSGRQSVLVIRPADSAETVTAWKMAMENTQSPTVLILSRQNLEDLPGQKGDRGEEAKGAVRGGYVVWENPAATVTLVGNGSEVANLIHAACELEKEGVNVRVVSVPSVGLFMRQDEDYRHSVIPRGGEVFGLTAGLPSTLYPLMKDASRWDVKGLERFGASAPYKVLEEKFGFTLPHVIEAVREFAAGK